MSKEKKSEPALYAEDDKGGVHWEQSAPKAQHTPGPWAIHSGLETNVIGHTGIRVARCDFDGADPCAESIATARLIAAAPELLAALKDLMEHAQAAAVPGLYWVKAEAIPMARAAIRKAEDPA